jgi:uncharacterized membrane protein YqhA
MKAKLIPVLKFLGANLLYIWLFFVFGLFIYAIGQSQAEHQNAVKKKDVEIVELRNKINNHLIAEGFYNKPAKDVLPVIKDFGIQP